MASSIIILKPVNDYSTVETIKGFKRAVIDSGMIINNMDVDYDSNKIAIGAEGSIGFVNSNNNLKQFLFTMVLVNQCVDIDLKRHQLIATDILHAMPVTIVPDCT